MQHARQRKTERRFFPLIPDRHLNFISSSITWPLLRLAALSLKKKKKIPFPKDSMFGTTTNGIHLLFFPTAVLTADSTRHRTTCTSPNRGRRGNVAAQYKSLLGRKGIRRHKPHKLAPSPSPTGSPTLALSSDHNSKSFHPSA